MGASAITKAAKSGPPTKASTTDCQMWVVVNCTSETTVPASGREHGDLLAREHAGSTRSPGRGRA